MSEYDEYKKDRQKLIEARRLKVSTPDGGAGVLKEDYQAIKPTTFKQKWDNYWYHYKFLTFGSIFALILVVSFVVQLVTRPVYDARLTVVSEMPFDNLTDTLKEKLSVYADDFTKNEKVELDMFTIQLDPGGKNGVQPEVIQASMAKLAGSLSTMDSFVYLVDETCYQELKGMELQFMDLTDLVDSERLVQPDQYALKDTTLAQEMGLGELSDMLYLCFVDYGALDEKTQNKKDIKMAYERDYAFFTELLNQQ